MPRHFVFEYYPWYGVAPFRHWNQDGHLPPLDLASNYLPQLGAYGQWVKAYDPRLDSSFPGGSGSHVLGDESTYEWTENPALHAATYAYGTPFFTSLDSNPRHLTIADVPRPLGSSLFLRGDSVA